MINFFLNGIIRIVFFPLFMCILFVLYFIDSLAWLGGKRWSYDDDNSPLISLFTELCLKIKFKGRK